MRCQQAAKLFALTGINNCFIERAPCHAASRCADTRAERVERCHCQPEAVAFVANHVFRGHAAIVEDDLSDWMRRHQRRALDHAEALHL